MAATPEPAASLVETLMETIDAATEPTKMTQQEALAYLKEVAAELHAQLDIRITVIAEELGVNQ